MQSHNHHKLKISLCFSTLKFSGALSGKKKISSRGTSVEDSIRNLSTVPLPTGKEEPHKGSSKDTKY